jgi:hypothetical protein
MEVDDPNYRAALRAFADSVQLEIDDPDLEDMYRDYTNGSLLLSSPVSFNDVRTPNASVYRPVSAPSPPPTPPGIRTSVQYIKQRSILISPGGTHYRDESMTPKRRKGKAGTKRYVDALLSANQAEY